MKKLTLSLLVMLFALTAQAQFKVYSDGWVTIGSTGLDLGIQVTPNGHTYMRTSLNNNYSLAFLSIANANFQKHWIVRTLSSNRSSSDNFYVYGNGTACSTNHYTIVPQNRNDLRAMAEPISGERALATILQLKGFYYPVNESLTEEEILDSEYVSEEAKEGIIHDLTKRTVALTVENLEDAFPDAVRTDPEARLCVDYQAIITMLTEAVKQQQKEIELLRDALEEHGLMR